MFAIEFLLAFISSLLYKFKCVARRLINLKPKLDKKKPNCFEILTPKGLANGSKKGFKTSFKCVKPLSLVST